MTPHPQACAGVSKRGQHWLDTYPVDLSRSWTCCGLPDRWASVWRPIPKTPRSCACDESSTTRTANPI